MEQAHPVQRFVVIEALAGVFVMGVVGADADARIVGIGCPPVQWTQFL
jgi:hypothetical protein